MKQNLPLDQPLSEYEAWFSQYPDVFRSEAEALRTMLPAGGNLVGIEVSLGTGRFAQALGIKEGVESSADLRAQAVKRGIEVVHGVPERLPYADMQFDFVLMAFCISYFNDLHVAFTEANRVLKKNSVLVVGFHDKNSTIGQQYRPRLPAGTFHSAVTFYTVDKVVFELTQAGFKHFKFCQTLFHRLEDIHSMEMPRDGYGEGSFVVIQASKV